MAKRKDVYNSQEKDPKLSSEESKRQLQFLLSFLKPFKWQFSFAFVILLLSGVVTLLFPAFIGKLIDIVLGKVLPLPPILADFIDSIFGKSERSLTSGMIIGGLFTVIIIQSVTRYFLFTMLVRISEKTLATIRTQLFERIISLPMKFFSERRVGELASRLSSDLTMIQDTFSTTFLEFVRQIITLIGGVAFIASKSLELTGMILLCLPVVVGIVFLFSKKIRKYSTKTQDALAEAATVVEETLQAIASVKSFVNEQYEKHRYDSAIQKGVSIAIQGAKIRSAFVSFIIFTIFSSISGVIWYGGNLVKSGSMSIGDLTSFMMYVMFVAGSLGGLAELYSQIQKSLGASVRVQEILSQIPEELKSVETATPIQLDAISVRDISFSYPGRKDITAISNVSFEIKTGERVAFVGESGAGKSTMAALLQRFYEPDEGEIAYNGTKSKNLSIPDVRKNVGVVPQDIILFGGSIAENIRYGKLDATDEEVWKAAKMANAVEFIEKFPEKLQTLVGERGVKLSGGQRQRVAIARAILKNPPILILDEATSSLDSQTEYLIQEAMERLMQGRTTIIIAHRLSTIRKCDKIFVFSHGKIIESGTHEELVSQKESFYAKLCSFQFGANKPVADIS